MMLTNVFGAIWEGLFHKVTKLGLVKKEVRCKSCSYFGNSNNMKDEMLNSYNGQNYSSKNKYYSTQNTQKIFKNAQFHSMIICQMLPKIFIWKF